MHSLEYLKYFGLFVLRILLALGDPALFILPALAVCRPSVLLTFLRVFAVFRAVSTAVILF